MKYRPDSLRQDFKAYKDGDVDAIVNLLRSEKERVYDFIIRLSGDVVRSIEITDNASSKVEEVGDDLETLEDLLITLYKTARDSLGDLYTNDTSKLENSRYDQHPAKDFQDLKAIELALRHLPKQQTEILLLRDRFGFALDEVAEIVRMPSTEVERLFALGLSAVEDSLPEKISEVPDLICSMLPFVRPEPEGVETQNLSHIMSDFRKTHSMARETSRWPKLFVLGLSLGMIYYFRLEIATYIHNATAQFLEQNR